MRIMVTGHRPQKLSYGDEGKIRAHMNAFLCRAIKKHGAENLIIISGMALGVDTWWFQEAADFGLAIHAYIPFQGQEAAWKPKQREDYRSYLYWLSVRDEKHKIITVCSPGFAAWKMQKRNEAMVDNSDVCVAYWNGTSGGTANCVEYAEPRIWLCKIDSKDWNTESWTKPSEA